MAKHNVLSKLSNHQEDIAEAFADFFEAVYKESGDDLQNGLHLQVHEEDLPALRLKEVRRQLSKMQPREAADDGGIVAEFLCKHSEKLVKLIADMSIAVSKPRSNGTSLLESIFDPRLIQENPKHVQVLQQGDLQQNQRST